MPTECYFLPSDAAEAFTPEALAAHCRSAGLPARVQSCDDSLAWIVFPPHTSQLRVSTERSHVNFVTLEGSWRDGPEVLFAAERILDAAGFKAVPDDCT